MNNKAAFDNGKGADQPPRDQRVHPHSICLSISGLSIIKMWLRKQDFQEGAQKAVACLIIIIHTLDWRSVDIYVFNLGAFTCK